MKIISTISAIVLVTVTTLVSCESNVALPSPSVEEDGMVTITASFPEIADSKVSMEETSGGLDLKWKDSDFLTVVGITTEKFTISSISDNGKTATFKGNPVQGETFKVILSDRGENYLTRSYSGQQNPLVGNDLKGNVPYDAVLEGVSDYTDVCFTKEWAEVNNATFSETGVIMLHVQVPEGCPPVKWVKFVAPEEVFSKDNSNDCDKTYYRAIAYGAWVDAIDGKMQMYWASSMNQDVIKSGKTVHVILEANGSTYIKDYTLTEDFNITPGKRNILRLNSQNWVEVNGQSADRSGWCAPYCNITFYNLGPGKLIDGSTPTSGNSNIWHSPYADNQLVFDTKYDGWASLPTGTNGDHKRFPIIGIFNLGQVEYLHTLKVFNRSANPGTYTSIELYVSTDENNESEDFERHALQNLVTINKEGTAAIGCNNQINGWWPEWKSKKWVYIGTNNRVAEAAYSCYGVAAKYIKLVVNADAANAANATMALSEMTITSYQPVE